MPAKKRNVNDSRIEGKLDAFIENFDRHMESVNENLSSMDTRLDKISITSAQNSVILDEHIRRTNLLEEKMEIDMSPLKVQSTEIKFMTKIIGAIVTAGGLGSLIVAGKAILDIFGKH